VLTWARTREEDRRVPRHPPVALAAAASALLAVLVAAARGVDAGIAIVDRLMDEKFSSARPAGAVVDMIVIHFSSDVVAHPDDPYDVERVIHGYEAGPASTHFLIDRGGKILRLVREERAAWHAGKGELPFEPKRKNALNATSIGIELLGMGSKEDMKLWLRPEQYDKVKAEHKGFTDEQYRALAALVDDLRARFPQIQKDRRHVVGHEEYAPGRRTDPGQLFDWKRIGLERERPR
jgi:N-acetyl-anhydromuramyl-L-alanine amidase AmpD